MIKFNRRKKAKFHKKFAGIVLWDKESYICVYFLDGSKKWMSTSETWNEEKKDLHLEIDGKEVDYYCNTFSGCNSIRAFRRRLREFSKYLPGKIRFSLMHSYKGPQAFGQTR